MSATLLTAWREDVMQAGDLHTQEVRPHLKGNLPALLINTSSILESGSPPRASATGQAAARCSSYVLSMTLTSCWGVCTHV